MKDRVWVERPLCIIVTPNPDPEVWQLHGKIAYLIEKVKSEVGQGIRMKLINKYRKLYPRPHMIQKRTKVPSGMSLDFLHGILITEEHGVKDGVDQCKAA